ncbi:LysR family transcriptional regulator [Nocardioides daejeonensis]|uniref:LysR family transcriptional regulator n=1 Tax=Nocardioides daejeonensis TaxID=1046556 RepID=UPI0013A5ADC5|nr:LysR family transcriptional regulator [Nocardioides daejeonensis]
MSWDLVSLQLLVAVRQHGSLGRAARELGMTQPAASARLRALEGQCGLNLVTRSPRGSALTEDGAVVCDAARRVLREADRFESTLATLRHESQRSLSIAASMTIAEHLVPIWVGQLRVELPDVVTGLVVANSDDVIQMVREGRVEMGFVESPVEARDLRMRTVRWDEVQVLVAPGHPWADRSTPVTRVELRRTPLVQREPGSGTRSTFERALGGEAPVALQASSTHAILSAARTGIGPAVVSAIAAHDDRAAGHLVPVRTELDLRRPLRAAWRPHTRLRSPLSDFLKVAAAGDG